MEKRTNQRVDVRGENSLRRRLKTMTQGQAEHIIVNCRNVPAIYFSRDILQVNRSYGNYVSDRQPNCIANFLHTYRALSYV